MINETCIWCGRPGTLSDNRPLAVHSVDTGESIETLRYHKDCDSFWSNCIFCKGVASAERPTFTNRAKQPALRFSYHEDCAENRVRTLYPWMFENSKAFDGRPFAHVRFSQPVREKIYLIGEGIRIQQRAWMRLPEPEAVR